MNALNESISISNQHLTMESSDLLALLNEKRKDPATAEKANYWYTKAEAIHNLSDEINAFIEKQKSQKVNSEKLYLKLMAYKQNIMNVDSQITYTFNSTFTTITKSFDSISNKENFTKIFFNPISAIKSVPFLNKLQNNIRINENKMLLFCNENINTDLIIEDFTSYSAIVAQNTSCPMPGELIEITAGVGSFSTLNKPEITINNKLIALEYDGAARYKIKSSRKPGKHYIPVKIEYTDQDGKSLTIQKTVEYTVMKEQ